MSTAAESVGDDGPNEIAQSLIDAIQRPRQADSDEFKRRGSDVWLPQLDLPGFGDAYDDCGDDIPHFCEDCGHSFAVGRTCKRSVCPRCAPAWVLDRAPGIVGRLDTVSRVMSARSDEPVYKHHVVFSPPDDWALEADDILDRTFHVIRELLLKMNAEGIVAYHPWAGADHLEGDDRGEWKKRLFSDRDWDGDVRQEVKPRGHFHAVVASPHIAGGETIAQVNQETDWVIKRVTKRDGSGRSLKDLEDVARATTYVLSHTGIDTEGDGNNAAAYRAYGSTYHDPDVDVYDDVQEAADVAVREVAPRTLGIAADAVRCGRQIDPDARDDDPTVDAYRNTGSGDAGDGDGDNLDDFDPKPGSSILETEGADGSDDLDESELVPCSGRVLHIKDAPEHLRDLSWATSARRVADLATAYRDWLADGDPPPD